MSKTVQRESGPVKNLTLYLIKENRLSADQIIRADPEIRSRKISISPTLDFEVFVKPRPTRPPKWSSFFNPHLNPEFFGFVSSSAAVLLVPAGARLFAFTFGQGRFLLVPDSWEERFGLKVVLNSIGESQIRSVDKETIHAIPLHAREQTGKDASVLDFGLDVERDLVRAVTGTPTSPALGRTLTGMDALRTTISTSIEALVELAETYFSKSNDLSYKEKFSWVDHLGEVKDSETREILDQLLVDRLREEKPENIWLAAPVILDWNMVCGFKYGTATRELIHHDLHVNSMRQKLSGHVTLETLRSNRITCVAEDDREIDEWPYYRCIQCELDLCQDSYLLSNGKWYRIDTDFARDVNEFYKKIAKADDLELPIYDDETETAYNKRIATADPEQFALMDCKLIPRETKRGDLEFCDLFSRQGDIIHVKRYSGSSALSHLFAQAHASGSALAGDEVFRSEVGNRLPPSFQMKVLPGKRRPDLEQYRVVFAIISQSDKPLSIPFFSRLSLRHTTRELRAYGFQVALTKIMVAETRKKRQVARGKPRKTF